MSKPSLFSHDLFQKQLRKWPKRVMWASFILSALGIVVAIIWEDASLGQRGGAIGVGLSFAILFMGNSTAERALSSKVALPAILDKNQTQEESENVGGLEAPKLSLSELRESERQLRGAVAAMLDWANLERRYLTASSVFSTFVWGFGDCLASGLSGALGMPIS